MLRRFLPGCWCYYFEVAHSTSLSIPDAVTVSAWFYPHSLSPNWRVVVAKVQPSPERSNYWRGHTGDEFHMLFHDESGWQGSGTSLDYTQENWYHLVGVLDNSDNSVRLYVNGDLVVDAKETVDFFEDLGSLWIGWAPGDAGIDGVIDEVAIWSRKLSQDDIRALYPGTIP